MHLIFKDRREAGRAVAARLGAYRDRQDALVLALSRSGVPVGQEVAMELHAPLDVLVACKFGLPASEEQAMGAVAAHGVKALNRGWIATRGVTASVVAGAVARAAGEVGRREENCRSGWGSLELRGRTVILVDDGVETGTTMRAAIAVARAGHAARVVAAVPVVAREAYLELRGKVEEFVTLQSPKNFAAIGDYYAVFPQVSDGEVCDLPAHAVR